MLTKLIEVLKTIVLVIVVFFFLPYMLIMGSDLYREWKMRCSSRTGR